MKNNQSNNPNFIKEINSKRVYFEVQLLNYDELKVKISRNITFHQKFVWPRMLQQVVNFSAVEPSYSVRLNQVYLKGYVEFVLPEKNCR